MATKIIDCFTFFNGLDVLEVRLNALAPYVDKFVLCESPYNMVGKKKPLIFDENKERFKQFPITHLIVHDHLDHMQPEWTPYFYQIDYMTRALDTADADTIVMLSDFDEFPDLTNYNYEEGGFRQRMYYYYFNVYTGNAGWKGTVALKRKSIKRLSKIRRRRARYRQIGKGWHFSYIATLEEIRTKIEAFCHRELDTEEIKNSIGERKANLMDIFNRSNEKFIVEMPSGPKWLLDNRDKYKHLFYKGYE